MNAKGARNKLKAFSESSLGPKRSLRGFGQQIGAARTGFKYGKEANNWEEMRNYTYGAASEQMSKPTLGDKVKGFYTAEADAHKKFYRANYEAFNSPAELAKAKKLDEISSALKKFEDKLDGTDEVKGAKLAVESIREHIKKGENFSFEQGGQTYDQDNVMTAEGMEKTLTALEKYEKERVGLARQQAYKDAKNNNNVEITSLAKEYRQAVTTNESAVIEAMKKVQPNVTISGNDLNVLLSDESLSGDNGKNWKNIRDLGAAAGKSSQDIKTRATKQQDIKKGN